LGFLLALRRAGDEMMREGPKGIQIFTCRNYTPQSGARRKVTAILTLIIEKHHSDRVIYSYSCSLAPSCHFACRYAHGWHAREKEGGEREI